MYSQILTVLDLCDQNAASSVSLLTPSVSKHYALCRKKSLAWNYVPGGHLARRRHMLSKVFKCSKKDVPAVHYVACTRQLRISANGHTVHIRP